MRIFLFYAQLVLLLLYFNRCNSTTDDIPAGADSLILPGDSLVSKYYSRIDTFFVHKHRLNYFSGVVLFAEKGIVVYENAFGYANIRSKDTLGIHSQFQLGSVTKPFTALAIMILKEKGLLFYEDSIRKFFPDFPYENITIYQLLIHRSGLPEYFYFADKLWKDSSNATITNKDVINLMIEQQPKRYYLPGQRYNYCNTNYAILAAIIETVTGKTYSQFMSDEIFEPLGMKNTSVYNKADDPDNGQEVVGYMGKRKADNSYLNGVVGDKGIYTTVEDLYLFDQALYNGVLVKKEEMDSAAYQPGNHELYDNDNYGYGWRINKREDGSKIVHHAGWWKGFRSYFIRDLKERKTIIILSNQSRYGQISSQELMELFDILY